MRSNPAKIYLFKVNPRNISEKVLNMFKVDDVILVFISLKGCLHIAKSAVANIVQVLAEVTRKVKRSKIHIAQVKNF